MNKFLVGLLFAGVLAVLLVYGLDNLAQSQADLAYQQGQARAMVIEAQGQARLDSAQATAITSAAMLPWVVLFCVSVVAIVCVVFLLRQPPAGAVGPRLIERQTVLLLQPGQSRRVLWQTLAEVDNEQLPLLR